jgi:hypothetical protein
MAARRPTGRGAADPDSRVVALFLLLLFKLQDQDMAAHGEIHLIFDISISLLVPANAFVNL